MEWNRNELKTLAKKILKKRYMQFFVVGLIFSLVSGVFSATYSADKTIIQGFKTGFTEQISIFQTQPTEKLTAKKFVENIVNNSNKNLQEKKDILQKINSKSDNEVVALIWGVIFIFLSIIIITAIIKSLIDIFFLQPLKYGVTKTCILGVKDKTVDISNVISAFKRGYGKIVLTLFLRELYVILWSLLLIVPGIVKRYEYKMVEYLLANDPTITRKDAFLKSKDIMKGNKWKAFVLDLSFIGWIFLGILTFGIVTLFWVVPYIILTETLLFFKLYELNYKKSNVVLKTQINQEFEKFSI